MARQNENYSFLVLSDRRAQLKKITLSRQNFKIVLGFFLGFIFIGAILFIHYVFLFSRQSDYNQIKNQNDKLIQQIGTLESKVHSVEKSLLQVHELSTKLSLMAGVSSEKTVPLSLGSTIGSEEDPNLLDWAPRDEWTKSEFFDELHARLDKQESTLTLEQLSLEEIHSLLQNQTSLLSATPSIKPLDGWITSGFGYRISPWTGKRDLHNGIDIAARMGSEVAAAADGVVVFAGIQQGFGKTIVINHGYDTVTRYAHNSSLYVKIGQKVKRGDTIAAVGNTGHSTGPHLHYEVVKKGKPIDPINFILD